MWSLSLPRHRRLSRYWNDLVAGKPPAELARLAAHVEPTRLEAIDRLAALDDARLPDPLFVERLERDLMRAVTLNPRTLTLLPPTTSVLGNGRYELPGRLPVPTSLPTRARRWAGTQLATAIVLVLILLGSFYVFYDNRPATLPPRQSSPTVAPATPDATPVENWPMYRNNPGRSGEGLGPAPNGDPIEVWSYQTDGPVTDPPILADGVVYIPSEDGHLYAFDAVTGEVRWSVPGVGGWVAVAGGLGFAHGEQELVAVTTTSGAEVWRVPAVLHPAWSPLVVDGVLYTPAQPNLILALDALTGRERWTAELGGPASRTHAISGGLLVIGSEDGQLSALDLATGAIHWTLPVSGDGVLQSPAIVDGVVYVGTFNGTDDRFYALDLATGQERWQFAIESKQGFYAPTIGAGMVFLPGVDGTLYALDQATGTSAWSFLASTQPQVAAPALVAGVLYLATADGNLLALDAATGAERWRYDLAGGVNLGPAVGDGLIVLGTVTGHVLAVGGAGDLAQAPTGTSTPAATDQPATSGAPTAQAPIPTAAAPATVAAPTPRPASASPAASPNAIASPVEFVAAITGGPEGLQGPGDIVFDPHGNLWITDGGRSRFQIVAPDGTFIETWGALGTGDGEFNFLEPNGDGWGGLAFDDSGNIYVADTGNHRIQKFDRDRTFVTAWGSVGQGNGQFTLPNDVEVDAQGNVYVSEVRGTRVQKFSAEGRFLLSFGSSGTGDGQFAGTWGLTIDAGGRIWVGDSGNRVQIFDANGGFVAALGSSGRGDGEFSKPGFIAFDGRGHVYVSDIGNYRIQVFDETGQFLAAWGQFGTDAGEFNEPGEIAIDAEGNVYVVDYSNARVQKFRLLPPLGPA